ncbi:hypothetical protein [Fischerella thermalis]|uniref:hypothetical protein n=1 Tax=Fischerella thermalis TaxID=372787 RepID=UPI000C7FA948|nr:hypothetical protein [Fischerella thermalis]PLZ13670.1 hypothetical protein CBP18_04335 [Fischerella thermalis WC119]PLZ14059.1 hypothetical protein CBP19_08905 [Fischerella thermalis WC1110]PLZ36476.1 hypothetical protein CBP26_21735 [Fischerella thermalis WC538]PLZ41424.1 hypothetical protein CBP25_17040 [Fischerella thermalis WC527]PLZ58925.1 hypothetical protein CBP23_20760 [Fischerella thermalis WC344]
MKNKILAIAATAGTAILGSSVFSTPAQALTQTQDVTINYTVPEILYLRTFQTVNMTLDANLLGATLTAQGSGFVGKDYDPTNATVNIDPVTGNADVTLDQTSPFGNLAAIQQSIPELYAVWSNSTGTVDVNLTSTPLTEVGGKTIAVNSITPTVDNFAAPGLDTPQIGGADLDLDLTNATVMGIYTGTITVDVSTP